MEKILFTSESVTEGHPDKMCDAISDAILDALMEKDPMSRVACETATTTGLVLVMGEITTNAYVDIQKIVRDTIREIGYTRGKYGFDADTCAVITAIDEQSADIALGVDKALEAKMGEDEIDAIGAGDQGIQFGYASNETEEYMPYAINMAHKLARQLTKIRKDGTLKYLRPDGKTQVTVEYDEAGKPSRIDAVVCSTQHDPDVTQEQIHEDIKKYVFDEIIPADMVDENTKYFINPTGRFVIGGPHGDSGLTGRKIIVDTYVETKQTKDENALATIRNIFSARTRDFITAIDDTGIIIIRELQSTETYEDLESIAYMLVDMLNTEAMTSAWVAYSNLAEDISRLPDAYKEAHTALEVGKIFYADKNVFGYNQLGIGRLIYQLPVPICEMFIDEIFKEETLDSIDEETLITIRTFFENNLNLSETSRQLYVHRNTLVYRFEKLQRKFGLDIRAFEDALTFKLAMMVVDYIKYSKNHPS